MHPPIKIGISSTKNNKLRTMARPIKETPVLYDEDAYRFEMAAHNVKPLPKKKLEEIKRAYDEVRSWCVEGVLCN